MDKVTNPGMVHLKSAFNGICQDYFMKNINNENSYINFLNESKPEILNVLEKLVKEGPIKYNLILEATYNIPETSRFENRAFKTSARSIFMETCLNKSIQDDFVKLLHEQEHYEGIGSGYTLFKIDGLLLNINKYKPIGGSSYIQLPDDIANRKATINVQNINEECFKYSILSKYVKTGNPQRPSKYYDELNSKYDFTGLSFPVSLKDIEKFEKKNPGVSINVYGIKKGTKTRKNKVKKPKMYRKKKSTEEYIIVPYKVCDDELEDHFDLLLIGNNEGKQHYCYITNLSRLISPQINACNKSIVICRRCFKSYSKTSIKNGLPSGEERLKDHKIKCNKNKPVLHEMPKPNSFLKFKNFKNSVRLPIAIYADFECLLIKFTSNTDNNSATRILQEHIPMSFCFYVKTCNVPVKLLKKYQIPTKPVLVRGDKHSTKEDVAKRFLEEIVAVARKIESLYKTNIPIKLTSTDNMNHDIVLSIGRCTLCESKFNAINYPVRDHNHLNGEYR
jgi:hypothetical protein